MVTKPFETRVFRTDGDGFPQVRKANVLIYWPHGFGDWVFLSHILPLLESSNRYFLTRFGDDNSSLYDGCEIATPIYLGHDAAHCGDGAAFGIPHFGMRGPASGNGVARIELPLAAHEACTRHRIDAVLDLPFWETYGGRAFPLHTKGRNMLRLLLPPERLASLDLDRALPGCLNFSAPDFVRAWVDARLRSLAGWNGRKLCVIARNGYTSTGKNWAHQWREDLPEGKRREGEEARDFLRLMQERDPGWLFVTMEDRHFSGDDTIRDRALRCVSYAELFGCGGMPFGLVVKALTGMAALVVGVPAGPYHLAMAHPGVPVIGLWTEHFPSWYDEPKAASVHLLSRNTWAGESGTRCGSFDRQGKIEFATRRLDSRIIPGEAVLSAVEELLALPTRQRRAPPQGDGARETGRMIAVTIGVGATFRHLAELSAESCREQTGLPAFIMDDDAQRRHGVAKPHHLKFRLFEEFPDAETILYFDADTIFFRRFDPTAWRDRAEFVCTRDLWKEPWIIEDARTLGLAPEEYFNSGFFILNRSRHATLLALAESLIGQMPTGFHDQTFLNAARARLGIPALWLSSEFNRLRIEQASDLEEVVVGHFRWIESKPLEMLRSYFEYWLTKPRAWRGGETEIRAKLTAGRFEYDRVGHDRRVLSLCGDGTVGQGSAGRERHWEMSCEQGSPVLWICGEDDTTLWLRPDACGGWRGRWIVCEKMPVRLSPLPSKVSGGAKEVQWVMVNWRRPSNIRRIVAALATQREHCAVTLIDAAPDSQFAIDEQTRREAEQYIVLRENHGGFNRFAPLLLLQTPFIYFHDDDMLPGRHLLQKFLQSAEEHPEFGLLGQEGRVINGSEYSSEYIRAAGSVREVDFVVRGYFVRRETLFDLPRLLGELGRPDPHCDDLAMGAAVRRAGFKIGVVPCASPQERMNQQELPAPYALSGEPDHHSRRTHFLQLLRKTGWRSLAETS